MLQKELSIAFYPDSYIFMFFEIKQVYLHSAAYIVYKGHKQNEWVRNPFGNTQRVANLSALSPVFSACIIYTHFIEIPLIDIYPKNT